MKLTKTLALAALVAGSLFAGNATLQAQDNTNTPPAGAPPGGPGMRGRPNLEQIAKDLGLTDDQKAKLKTIMEDQQTKMKALRADTSIAQTDKRAKAKEIRDATQAQIKAILTPEQLTKWQQHMQRNRPPGGTPPATPPQQ
jgi:protein CpxP